MRSVPVAAVVAVSFALAASATASERGPGAAGAVLTQETQRAMTQEQAMQRLRDGNARFVAGKLLARDLPAQVKATAQGQFPFAVVLSCLDSRIPVEYVFDQGIGDLFTARVAGNFVNDDILGSMEFATQVVGSKLIVVMGHTSCGAVKGSCDNVQLGKISDLVNEIQPSVQAVAGHTCTSKDAAAVDKIADHNVGRTIAELRRRSAIIRDQEARGEVKIVGAMYDVATGKVSLHDADQK
ncbi:MAG: carbonic anhydrase family protein [bacterium]